MSEIRSAPVGLWGLTGYQWTVVLAAWLGWRCAVFGGFICYLPEHFPTRLRGIGSGFGYNIGRVVAAVGPLLVGTIAARGASALDAAMGVGPLPA